MATQALRTPKTLVSRPAYRPVNRTMERIFFGGMAILLCVVVIVGFTPTYFGAGMVRAPLPSPILHVHGAAFTLWMVLYLVQSALISVKRVKWHRSLGTIAFCLPPVMIVLGLIAAIDALHRKVSHRAAGSGGFAVDTAAGDLVVYGADLRFVAGSAQAGQSQAADPAGDDCIDGCGAGAISVESYRIVAGGWSGDGAGDTHSAGGAL